MEPVALRPDLRWLFLVLAARFCCSRSLSWEVVVVGLVLPAAGDQRLGIWGAGEAHRRGRPGRTKRVLAADPQRDPQPGGPRGVDRGMRFSGPGRRLPGRGHGGPGVPG